MAEDKRRDHRQRSHELATRELRRWKPGRAGFAAQARNSIMVVLDRVTQNYNLGAIFRLCDAFLVERLVVCGVPVTLHKRKRVQAAAGTQHWVPWEEADDAAAIVRAAKAAGHWIAAVELTVESVSPATLQPQFPAIVVLGGESSGVSHNVLACADQAVAITRLGMANSRSIAKAAAIVLYELVRRCGWQIAPKPPTDHSRMWWSRSVNRFLYR
jgi:tRNA G18 (ribose-2'-O)-methylase SpoU